ncbi:M16 family metallopeptidase [Archangium primigenium]|uniref:M16 family metallopeptidase n=1 Tax=[Archangium] primigenium TaxID=2792470 RepID=UPI001958993B|nr:pitrilysin family protein [Archangium primigenium]MBM7112514.1 insulinase family protein [Archangium primigenium]
MPLLSRPRLLVLGLLLAAAPALAQAPASKAAPSKAAPASAPPAPVTSVEGISEYRLPNGLRVLLFPDPTKSTVTVNLTYFVGSRHEGYGETGMAHLLEHLMFKGTPTTPNVPQALTQRGARPNGTTWLDRTNYYETLPASGDNLRWALGFEADRMRHSFIAQKDLDSEMTVVRNELERGENSPQRILNQRVMSAAYAWHNYGKPTIGARADLEHVPIERLQAFYKRYYRPDNALLVIAGQFDPARALADARATLGRVPVPKEPLPVTYTEEPTQDGERRVTLRRVGDVSALSAVYHVPEGAHPDFAAIDVLTHALGNTPSGRLYKALVETKKATSASAYNLQLHDPGVLTLSAEVREGQSLDAAREALLATAENAAATPFTPDEVNRAKTSLLKSVELLLRDSEGAAIQLSEWAAAGDWRLLFLHRDRIEAVTPEDVTRVASQYLKQSNRTLGEFIPTPQPDRAPMPPRVDLTAMLQGYQGRGAVVAGEAFDPSPANIERRVTRSTLGGLQLALLPKKTRGEMVNVSLALRWGTEQALQGRDTAADLAGSLLMRGTRKHSRQELRDTFDRLRARVGVEGGATGATVWVEAPTQSLPEVLALVAEVLREPAFEPREFELLRQERLASLESQKSEPTVRGRTAFYRALSPYPKGHPYHVDSVEESLADVQAVTLEQVRAFHRDFYGASKGELAAVGDFEPEALVKQVGALFGDWKSPAPYARVEARPYQRGVAGQVVETPDKANALFLAGQGLDLRDDDPDYPALVLGNFVLGGGFLNSRLATRVRQKDGLSYTVSSSLSAGVLDPVGLFSTYAIYAPQNAERLETAVREELQRVLDQGFTAEEVDKARAGLLEYRRTARADDGGLARTLAAYLYYGRTLAFDEAFEKRMAALKPADIRAALGKRLDWKQVTVVKAGDFEGARTKASAPPAAGVKTPTAP